MEPDQSRSQNGAAETVTPTLGTELGFVSAFSRHRKDDFLIDIATTLNEPNAIHKVLSSAGGLRPEIEVPFVAPSSATEKEVAGFWTELLGFEQIGINDSFFDLGGHSLLAMQILAMLRGIPVLASNVGGLLEAKLGVDYVLPVHRIEKYEDRRDENGIPIPIIPAQEIEPWESALQTVLSDRPEFERISAASRKAAIAYAVGLSLAPAEQYLEDLLPRRSSIPSPAQAPRDRLSARLAGLPTEQLEALAGLLKNKSRQN